MTCCGTAKFMGHPGMFRVETNGGNLPNLFMMNYGNRGGFQRKVAPSRSW